MDDGPGIPPASLERIFELFYRDPDSSRAVAGSGIGLFVCASLVEAMGGRIWARRPPEGGSEIGFTLRALEPDASDADAADFDGRSARAVGAPADGPAASPASTGTTPVLTEGSKPTG